MKNKEKRRYLTKKLSSALGFTARELLWMSLPQELTGSLCEHGAKGEALHNCTATGKWTNKADKS